LLSREIRREFGGHQIGSQALKPGFPMAFATSGQAFRGTTDELARDLLYNTTPW
jgi:hypothetical protein